MAHGGKAVAGKVNESAQLVADSQGYGHFVSRNDQGDSGCSAAQQTVAGPPKPKDIGDLYDLLPPPLLPHDLKDGLNNWEIHNQRIPAGYTYLLQFVAHDLVQTTVPFWLAAEKQVPTRNMRLVGLQLDTLYGGGPVACPAAFKPAGQEDGDRYEIRTGRFDGTSPTVRDRKHCPVRDLARLGDTEAANFMGTRQVVTADARNDDNIILTQLTALFATLHNGLVNQVKCSDPTQKFEYARIALLKMYYEVICNDLLKKMLHKTVWSKLKRDYGDLKSCISREAKSDDSVESRISAKFKSILAPMNWIWDGKDIPVEFSHGAFRVGHAMVREFYRLNGKIQDLNTTEVVDGYLWKGFRYPLPRYWAIDWDYLFSNSVEKEKPNCSRRLDVTKSSLDQRGLFESRGVQDANFISARDWLSSVAADNCSWSCLTAKIHKKYKPPADIATISVANSPQWLQKWFKKLGNGTLDQAPLPLLILLEANTQTKGETLGIVGSAIVGEVIFVRLVQGLQRLIESEDFAGLFYKDADNVYSRESRKRINKVVDMPTLIKLAQDWCAG
jgi:hypothetical protein